MKSPGITLIITLVCFLFVLGSAESKNGSGYEELTTHLEELLYPSELDNARWGAALFDLHTEELVFAENYNKSIIPASNQKLLTTAVALEVLGSDYRFQTQFYLDAREIARDTVRGDLYIQGKGDPSFTGRFHDDKNSMDLMEDLIEEVFVANRIKALDGEIVVDAGYFCERSVEGTWENEDLSYWYAVAADSLNFNENIVTYEISVSSNEEVELSWEPDFEYLTFEKQITTNEDQSTRISYERDDANVVHIEGNIQPGDSISRRVNVAEPADYFLAAFRTAAENKNIDMGNASFRIQDDIDMDYDDMTLLYSHLSTPFEEIIDLINKSSHNFYADTLLRTLGRVEKENGSFSGGGEVIAETFADWGIETYGMYVQDGSGLARRNLVTPRLLIELFHVMQDKDSFDMWLDSLPHGGRDGTLRNRFRNRDIEGDVFAKTGFINKVRALSGYIVEDDNPRFAFVLICNDYLTSTGFINDLQEKFCEEVWQWHSSYEQDK